MKVSNDYQAQLESNPDFVGKIEDDGEWEDVPNTRLPRRDSDLSSTSRARSATPSVLSSPRSVRKRKVGKTVFVAHPQPLSRRQAPKPRKERLVNIDSDQAREVFIVGAASSVRYVGAVLTHALRLLKRPLGILLFLWLLGSLLVQLNNTFRAVFAPFCWIPGISSSPFCQAPRAAEGPQWADYPRLVEIQSSSFEQLLDGTVGGSALSLEIKKAEMATKDLVTLVQISDLKSRDTLAESLIAFVEDAKKTGRGLQKLGSKINGAVDQIMAINDHALQTIEGAQAQPNSLLRVIWPLGSVSTPTRETVVETFKNSMEVHEAEIRKLILELEVSYANLDRLDTHLTTLHALCARENLTVGTERNQLLSELWTILGGNRGRLRKYATNLELLKDLGEYRKRAAAHVAVAMQTLLAMGEDMEDLRERVAAPDLAGDRIPVEVHMKSIRSGMERLKEQRVKAREREDLLMNRILGIDA